MVDRTSSQESTTPLRGRLLLLAAAVLWSTSGLLVKCEPMQAIALEHRGPLVACYRVLFAALVIVPFIRWREIRFSLALIGMALSYASMNILYVTALTRTTAAAAIFLQYTSTAWAYLFGVLLLGERGDRGSRVALIFAMCGIAWIIFSEWNGDQLTGNLLALASGLSYSGVVIGLRALRGEQAAWLVFVNSLVAGLVLLPWVLTFDVTITPVQWTVIAGLGIFQMGVPYLLFALGLRYVQASEAALLTLLEAVLNPIWVWLVLSEVAPISTWAGGLLILAGLVVRYTLFAPRRDVV
ncbi:MAG: EamA family transporter [Planctomycetaceae bacterium]|nr:EamA family transporter [Planctomycetaceae bacterium]